MTAVDLPQSEQGTRRRTRRARIWQMLLVIVLLFACSASMLLLVLLDQTSLAAQVYIQSINSGNPGIARTLGDQFSDEGDLHRRFFDMDIQRDIDWLSDADITDLTTSREQTLSGQWATILRFNYRPHNSPDPARPAILRVKTVRWFVFTYIRAVEIVDY